MLALYISTTTQFLQAHLGHSPLIGHQHQPTSPHSQAASRIAHEEHRMTDLQQLDELRDLQQQISIGVVREAKPGAAPGGGGASSAEPMG